MLPQTDIYRLASGRRRHNQRIAALAELRRLQIVRILPHVAIGRRGWKVSELARKVGCHRSTSARDLERIARDWYDIRTISAEQAADAQAALKVRFAVQLQASGFKDCLDGHPELPQL